jgi:hypothetical protein
MVEIGWLNCIAQGSTVLHLPSFSHSDVAAQCAFQEWGVNPNVLSLHGYSFRLHVKRHGSLLSRCGWGDSLPELHPTNKIQVNWYHESTGR